jgi:hypothetical protein
MSALFSFSSLVSKLGFSSIKKYNSQEFKYDDYEYDPVIESLEKKLGDNIETILKNISSDIINHDDIIEKNIELPKYQNQHYGCVSEARKLNGCLKTITDALEDFPYNNNNYVVVNASYTDKSDNNKYFNINFKIVKPEYINGIIKNHFANHLDFI